MKLRSAATMLRSAMRLNAQPLSRRRRVSMLQKTQTTTGPKAAAAAAGSARSRFGQQPALSSHQLRNKTLRQLLRIPQTYAR